MQSADVIELIKQRIPIAELIGKFVPLKPRGVRFVAPCPFHDESDPSFNVDPTRGRYHCYGCGLDGDVIDFWMGYHGVSFREALEALADQAGVALDADRDPAAVRRARDRHDRRQQIAAMYRVAQVHFRKNLASPKGADCRAYLQGRGVSEDLLQRFGLGWALDDWHDLTGTLQREGFNVRLAAEGGLVGISQASGKPYDPFRARLMFPIRDTSGMTIAFGGRIIGSASGQAKYVNTSDSIIYKKGEHLYGLDLAGQAIRRTRLVFVTEGYMDVLTMHQFGFTNAVGGLGTALTDQQAKRLLGYSSEVMLLYDGDNAGRKAALAASQKFLAYGAKTKVILLPEGEDIDSLLRGQGAEFFKRLQAVAKPALQFCAETVREWAPRDAVQWGKNFIRSIQLPELVSPAISYLSRHLGFDEAAFRRGLGQDHGQAAGRQAPAPVAPPSLSALEEEILRCAVRYPDRIEDLFIMGAEFLLFSSFAKGLWKKLAEAKPGEAGYALEGEERAFWNRWRGPEAPDLTVPELELKALSAVLYTHFSQVESKATAAVLRRNAGNEDAEGVYSATAVMLPSPDGWRFPDGWRLPDSWNA